MRRISSLSTRVPVRVTGHVLTDLYSVSRGPRAHSLPCVLRVCVLVRTLCWVRLVPKVALTLVVDALEVRDRVAVHHPHFARHRAGAPHIMCIYRPGARRRPLRKLPRGTAAQEGRGRVWAHQRHPHAGQGRHTWIIHLRGGGGADLRPARPAKEGRRRRWARHMHPPRRLRRAVGGCRRRACVHVRVRLRRLQLETAQVQVQVQVSI